MFKSSISLSLQEYSFLRTSIEERAVLQFSFANSFKVSVFTSYCEGQQQQKETLTPMSYIF